MRRTPETPHRHKWWMSEIPSVLALVFRCNCGAVLTGEQTILEALNLKEARIKALERIRKHSRLLFVAKRVLTGALDKGDLRIAVDEHEALVAALAASELHPLVGEENADPTEEGGSEVRPFASAYCNGDAKGVTDPRNPAFLINDEEAWRMPKEYRFHWSWWRWLFWRWVWVRRYRAALAQEEPK